MTNDLDNSTESQETPKQPTTKEQIAKIKEIIKEVYPFNKFVSDTKNPRTIHLKFIHDGALYPIAQTNIWQEHIISKLKEQEIKYVSSMWQTATKQGYGPYQLYYMIIEK